MQKIAPLDITERLAGIASTAQGAAFAIMLEASNEITRLRATIGKLEKTVELKIADADPKIVKATDTGAVTSEQALEALDAMDDYARMNVGVDAKGPRAVLERLITQSVVSKTR